jgi:hypothetical protein
MATYNGERFVGEQLRSILDQERLPDELIVNDDASSDATVAIASEMLSNARFAVEVVVNERRLGVVKNFEQGISRAVGDIVVLSDQDDVWWPNKLQMIEDHLMTHPDTAGVFSDATLIDGFSVATGDRLWTSMGFSSGRLQRWQRGDSLGVLLQGNVVTGAALAFRSSLRSLLLPIPDVGWHDLWIALLLASTTRLDPLPPLLDYRVHSSNVVGVRASSMRAEAANRRARPDERRAMLEQYLSVRTRLVDHSEIDRGVLMGLDGKIAHLTFRCSLASSVPRRAMQVLSEAAAGRYHRYSGGLRSVLLDLRYAL